MALYAALTTLAWGCESDPVRPEVVSPAADDAQVASAVQPASDACVDWSKADLSELPAVPESRYRRVFEQVWKLVLDKHYDPTLGCVDWVAARARYGEKLAQTRDRTEAFAVINDMLDELGQSHVKLFSPASDEAMGPASVQLGVRWIQDSLVVVDAPEDSPVVLGTVLESVAGIDVDTLVDKARTRVQRDEEFPALVARLAAARLSCAEPGQTRRVVVRGAKGEPQPEPLPCRAAPGELMSLGNLTNIPTRVEHHLVEDTTVGVLAFNVWMLPMLPKIQAGLAELKAQGMTALVLDLRGNPGGVGPMAVSVARSLLTEPGSLGKLEMRAFTQEFNVTPAADAFAGPLAVLVDEGTASTSEIFAAGLRDLGRAKIYGARPSAGAALPSLIEQLDGGALFQYVVGDYHSPHGVVVEGRGVVPDRLIPETRADFRAGKDPVLEAAVQDLTGT